MTYKAKEGDFLEYRGDGVKKSYHDFTIGKIYIVKKNCFGLYIMPDTNMYASTVVAYFKDYGFHLVTTPPETIQHEGYNYTRGEPVVPEWVKDGAWVVYICSGELRKVKEVKPGVFDLVVNDLVSIRYQDAIRDQYRPFTNADWKWGMWAEYDGKRAFVMTKSDSEGAVQISHETFLFGCRWVDADLLIPTFPD